MLRLASLPASAVVELRDPICQLVVTVPADQGLPGHRKAQRPLTLWQSLHRQCLCGFPLPWLHMADRCFTRACALYAAAICWCREQLAGSPAQCMPLQAKGCLDIAPSCSR